MDCCHLTSAQLGVKVMKNATIPNGNLPQKLKNINSNIRQAITLKTKVPNVLFDQCVISAFQQALLVFLSKLITESSTFISNVCNSPFYLPKWIQQSFYLFLKWIQQSFRYGEYFLPSQQSKPQRSRSVLLH